MAGSVTGGKKAAQKIKQRDPDFFKKIGAIGGKRGTTGGFAAATPEQRREWGRKGGKASKRTVVQHGQSR